MQWLYRRELNIPHRTQWGPGDYNTKKQDNIKGREFIIWLKYEESVDI